MRNVPILLEVRQVEIHGVTQLNTLDVVRSEVTANRGQVDVHVCPLADDLGLLLLAGRLRIAVLGERIELLLLVDDERGWNRLRVVRLPYRREVEEQAHLVSLDRVELCRLRELGPGREIAVL